MKFQSLWNMDFGRKATPIILGRIFALFSVIIVLAGCKSNYDAELAKLPGISGDYILETINGNKLPFAPPHHGGAPQVTSGMFTIKSDGTCTSKIHFTPPSGKAMIREVRATYEREGNTLRMKWHGAGRTIGTLDGDSFTMKNEGVLFSYRKQP